MTCGPHNKIGTLSAHLILVSIISPIVTIGSPVNISPIAWAHLISSIYHTTCGPTSAGLIKLGTSSTFCSLYYWTKYAAPCALLRRRLLTASQQPRVSCTQRNKTFRLRRRHCEGQYFAWGFLRLDWPFMLQALQRQVNQIYKVSIVTIRSSHYIEVTYCWRCILVNA